MAKLYLIFLFVLLYSFGQGKCSSIATSTSAIDEIKLESTLTTEKAPIVKFVNETVQLSKQDLILKPTLLQDKSESRDFGVSLFIIGTLGVLFALPIALVVGLVLLTPVPGLFFPNGTLPGYNNGLLVTGRELASTILEDITQSETVETFRGVMESDICVQRISCEIMKASKEINMDRWLHGIMNDIPVGQSLKRKINRGALFTRNCRRFSCDPLASVWKMFT